MRSLLTQPFFLLLLGLSAFLSPAQAQKTDIVVLMNGDRITGEVTELQRGLLRFKTDDAGTLRVEWDKVRSLTSRNTFEVELETERKLFGTLGEGPDPGTMVVAGEVLEMITIVSITEISPTFWDRTSGYLDMGWTLAKANKAHTTNFGAEGRYRGQRLGGTLNFSFYQQGQEDSDITRRSTGSLDLNRFIGTVWAWRFFAEASQNDELSLDQRTFVGSGARRRIVRTNRLDSSVSAGVVASRERYEDQGDDNVSAEVVLAADFLAFRLDSPELDVSSGVQTFASLTESERYRTNLNVRVKYELLADFFVALTWNSSYDTNPPSEAAAKSDYTSALSVGWSW